MSVPRTTIEESAMTADDWEVRFLELEQEKEQWLREWRERRQQLSDDYEAWYEVDRARKGANINS